MGKRGPDVRDQTFNPKNWVGYPVMALLFLVSTALLGAWALNEDGCELPFDSLGPRIVWLAAMVLLGASVCVGVRMVGARSRRRVIPVTATLLAGALLLLELYVFVVLNVVDSAFCSAGIE